MTKLRFYAYFFVTVAAFAVGRYSATMAVRQEVHTNQAVATHRQVIRTKRPDGTVQTVSTTDTSSQTQTSSITVKTPGSKANISLLAGTDLSERPLAPVFGVSITKEVLGPISVGIFGLNNGVAGVSVGLSF